MVEKDANGNVIRDYFDVNTDTYQLVAQLNGLKETYPALNYGIQREMWSSSDLYAFSRRIDSGINAGEEMICVFKTSLGKNVYIAGNSDALGNWNVDHAAGSVVCPTYPTWTVFVDVPAGSTIEWKALKKERIQN